jgi:putative DNA primase/helicase
MENENGRRKMVVQKETHVFKDNWRAYQNLSLIPYPASKSGKNPIVPWKDDLPVPCSDDYAEWEEKYPDANIWVKIGDGFAVIDPDGPGAERFVRGLNLPKCPVSNSGKKSTHRWSKISYSLKPIKVKMDDGSFLEFRTGQMGMFVPPSIHPETQKPYRWVDGQSPWEIPFPEFPIEAYEKIRDLLPKPEPRMMPAGDNNFGSLDVGKYLNHWGIKYRVKQDTGRTFYLLERCFFAGQHTTKDIPGDSSVVQGSDGRLGYHCFHNHCVSKTWADARKVISGDESIIQFFSGYVAPIQEKEQGPLLLESAILEVDHFISTPVPIKRMILKPWLSEQSITEISGWRGTGKTWCGVSIVNSATSGEPWGPWKVATLVPALYVDGELPAQDVQDRFKQLATHGRKEPLYIYSEAYARTLGIPRANLLNHNWREALKGFLIKKGIKLLGLDNVSSLAPGIDENSKKDWDPINQWFLDLRFAGIATIFFHHTSKTGDQRGTSGREDNLDCSILLQRPPHYMAEQGAKFIVQFRKSRVRTNELNLVADVEFALTEVNGRVQWIWGTVKRKNQFEILKMLDRGISQAEIAKTLAIDKGYVSRVKSKAIKDGHLSQSGKLTKSALRGVNLDDFEDET